MLVGVKHEINSKEEIYNKKFLALKTLIIDFDLRVLSCLLSSYSTQDNAIAPVLYYDEVDILFPTVISVLDDLDSFFMGKPVKFCPIYRHNHHAGFQICIFVAGTSGLKFRREIFGFQTYEILLGKNEMNKLLRGC